MLHKSVPVCKFQHVGISSRKFPIQRYEKKTCHLVVLLMDNDRGYFEAFQRENIVMCYFTPNLISWKQPCDLGVIAVVKNRYKFLFLKDVLSFYWLANDNQRLLKKKVLNFVEDLLMFTTCNCQIKLIILKRNGTKLLMKLSKMAS